MQCPRCAFPVPEGSRFCNSCGADVGGDSDERSRAGDLDRQLRDLLQEQVGRDFVVGKELGRGGMAVVFEARDAHLGRTVAIKILPPELTFGRGLVERFKREARMAATLDHPHIIPIFRVSTGGRLFWYVMKYLEGEPLAEQVKREGPQPFDVTVDVVEQVADALQYAHEHGVIHRDVKPANVMLDARGWVTVTDFGIAKASSEQSMTGSGSMIGTPDYMSPEQCSGKKVTGASDQYALGIVAYQMLSGQLPFSGESAFEVIKQHCMDPPPPLREVNPAVPAGMVAVVERAIAKGPEDRFPSVLDFATALREAWEASRMEPGAPPLAGTNSSAGRSTRRSLAPATPRPVRPALARDVPAQPPAPTEIMRPEELPRQQARPGRLTAAPVIVVAVLAVAGGVFGAWKVFGVRGAPAPSPRTAAAPAARADSAAAPPRTPTGDSAPSPADPAAAQPRAGVGGTVSFAVTNLPIGAELRFDGQPVTGTSWRARGGVLHIVAVTAPGYEPWSGNYVLRAGASEYLDFRRILRRLK